MTNTPAHNAFEVDDPPRRKHWAFVMNDQQITLFDTTKANMPVAVETFSDGNLPFGKTLQECYQRFFERAKLGVNGITFVRYVNPQDLTPLDASRSVD